MPRSRNPLLAFTAATILVGSGCAAPQLERPNVVILTVDTIRADRLGCYGYAEAHTPNLDAFASERAVRFDQAATAAPITLPAHCSILSGTYPVFHGVHDNDGFILDEGVETLAEILAEAGYSTGAVVGAYPLEGRFNLDQGFDHYDDDFRADWTQSELAARTDHTFGFVERSAAKVNAAASGWLDQHDGSPFFLWLHYFDPHQSYQPPAPYDSMFTASPYDGEIAYVDENFGDLIADLEERGVLDNTVVVVVGDHGESLGDHDEQTHAAFVYDTTMRVPFLMSAPDPALTPGSEINTQVRTIDIAPTVLELVGLRPGTQMQGRSLLPVLRNPQGAPTEPALMECLFPRYHYGWAPLRAVRTEQWKYVLAPVPELYGFGTDPGEHRNLVQSEPERAEQMSGLLDSLVARFEAPSPLRSVATTVDDDVRANLAALGYLEGGDGSKLLEPFPTRDELETMINPRDRALVLAYANFANEFLRMGHPDRSLESARQGLDLDPENPMLRLIESRALMGLELYQQASQVLEEVIAEEPSSASHHEVLGYCYSRLDRLDEARRVLEIAGELDGSRLEAFELLGDIEAKLGDFQAAVEAFGKVLAVDESRWMTRLRMATALAEAGRLEEARTSYQLALDLNPGSPVVLQQIGLFYLRLGEVEFGHRALAQAVGRAPEDAQLRLQLVHAMNLGGAPPEDIRRQLSEAIRLAPGSQIEATARQWMESLDSGGPASAQPPPDLPSHLRSDLENFHVEG